MIVAFAVATTGLGATTAAAQAPPVSVNTSCPETVTVATFKAGDKVSGTAVLTSPDGASLTDEGEMLVLAEVGGSFKLSVSLGTQASASRTFRFTAAGTSLTACQSQADQTEVGTTTNDEIASVTSTVMPSPQLDLSPPMQNAPSAQLVTPSQWPDWLEDAVLCGLDVGLRTGWIAKAGGKDVAQFVGYAKKGRDWFARFVNLQTGEVVDFLTSFVPGKSCVRLGFKAFFPNGIGELRPPRPGEPVPVPVGTPTAPDHDDDD